MASSSSSSSSSLSGRCGAQPPSTGHLYGTATVAHLLSNEDVHRLHARIGELTMENEALRRHVEGCQCGAMEVSGRLQKDVTLSTVSSAQLIMALAESVRSGVPPLVEAGETGEAIAVLWGAVKEKIRQAHELGYRSVCVPMMALSPLPAAIADRRSAGRPLTTVMERDEDERAELRDDLSEDIVRLKDIREGLGSILGSGKGVEKSPTSMKGKKQTRQSFPCNQPPPPATPATRKRAPKGRPSPSPIKGYPPHSRESKQSFQADHLSSCISPFWSPFRGSGRKSRTIGDTSLFDISESTHFVFRDSICSDHRGSTSSSKLCREVLREDAVATITALESAFGKEKETTENNGAHEGNVSPEYIMTRRRFST